MKSRALLEMPPSEGKRDGWGHQDPMGPLLADPQTRLLGPGYNLPGMRKCDEAWHHEQWNQLQLPIRHRGSRCAMMTPAARKHGALGALGTRGHDEVRSASCSRACSGFRCPPCVLLTAGSVASHPRQICGGSRSDRVHGPRCLTHFPCLSLHCMCPLPGGLAFGQEGGVTGRKEEEFEVAW